MMISSVVRDRVSESAASAGAVAGSGGEAHAGSAEEAQHPFVSTRLRGHGRSDARSGVRRGPVWRAGTQKRRAEGWTVTDGKTGRLPIGLTAELTRSLVALWTQYAGKRPTNARTKIRGNVVTCVLVDSVGDFDRSMIASQTHDTLRGAGKLTPAGYKRDAVAAVVRLTRQRVVAFVSSHDRDTDVATEVFTLEPSLSRGAPRGERRSRQASWLLPTAPARTGT